MSYWSCDETKCLVEAWKEVMVQQNIDEIPVVRNCFLYIEIQKKMAEHGYNAKTWKQCRTKIKGLVTKYRKVNKIIISYFIMSIKMKYNNVCR